MHTLEPVCENVGRGAGGGDGRVKDIVEAVWAFGIVLHGYALDAAGVHAPATAASPNARPPTDGIFLFQGTAARDGGGACRTLGCARGGAVDAIAVKDGGAALAGVKVFVEATGQLVGGQRL